MKATLMMNRKKIIFILFSLLAVYAIWNARNLLLGPEIDFIEPVNGATITDNPVFTQGIIKNASFITMNGYRIYTDKSGFFREEVGLYPGYNIIEVVAQDRFGDSIQKTIRLYYSGKVPELKFGSTSTSTIERQELETILE